MSINPPDYSKEALKKSQQKPAVRSRRWIWYVILPILAALLVWAGDTLYHAVRVYQQARQAQRLLDEGLSKQNLSGGIVLLHTVYADFSAVEQNVRPLLPLLDLIGRIPGPGKYAAQARPLMSYAESGLRAADLTARSVSPILARLSDEKDTTPALEMVVYELSRSQDGLDSASAALEEAQDARARIQVELLPEKLRAAIQKVDRHMPLAQGGLALLGQFPELAGGSGERTYLLAAQNSDELRPTGGFLSALGVLKIASGKILTFDMQDSYAVDDFSKDYPYPPEPIQRFMLAGYWVPRDANWYADFPTSAQKLQELYELSTGVKTAGVIVFDQSAVASLVRLLGPQQIAGMPEPLTGANTAGWIRKAWSAKPEKGVELDWWSQRKNFIGLVGKSILSQLSGLKDEEKAAAILSAGVDMLRGGHLLVYLNQPLAQAGLAQAGLDGGVQAHPGTDFLMLVDSNIGFNKVDALMQRSIHYRLDLSSPASPTARLAASYTHLARQPVTCRHEAAYGEDYAALEQRCYWDYWRVLTAPGSELTGSNSPSIPRSWLLTQEPWQGQVAAQVSETGLSEFNGLLVLETASTGGFELEWTLPTGVLTPAPLGWSYRLRIQKQPGLAALPVTIDLLPPAGCKLVNPQDWQVNRNGYTWSQKIQETTLFELQFSCP